MKLLLKQVYWEFRSWKGSGYRSLFEAIKLSHAGFLSILVGSTCTTTITLLKYQQTPTKYLEIKGIKSTDIIFRLWW